MMAELRLYVRQYPEVSRKMVFRGLDVAICLSVAFRVTTLAPMCSDARRQVHSAVLKESHATCAMLMLDASRGARDRFRLDSSSLNGETVLFLKVGLK